MEAMMKHEHLPALKRYTSQAQYDALKSIEETKSIRDLVFSGNSNRTLGVLVRSAWINTFPYVDNGVKYEGWCVTDAGKHAMTMFEEHMKIEKVKEEKRKSLKDNYFEALLHAYELERDTKQRREELSLELRKLEVQIELSNQTMRGRSYLLSHSEQREVIARVQKELAQRAGQQNNGSNQ
jgi:hypothetical protein